MAERDVPELAEGLNLLERYTIIDHIGGGGMAAIYRAHDSRLDRVVCVKLLRDVIEGSGSSGGGFVYQATYTHFLQEARALSRLVHPNTLRIYDFGFLELDANESGSVGPRPFQISEFLDGGNLEQYVRTRGPLKPAEVLAVLDRIAGAVAEAHDVNILHRDIKPSNILFSRVGDVLMPKLADFGIARAVRRRPKDGETEDMMQILQAVPLFSPRWAAPEQLQAVEEGPYTDVYALGLVVAFMLSGEALFALPDVTSTFADRVRDDRFAGSRLALHPYAPEVARVLMDALRADARVRTQSAFEFYEALSQAFGSPRASLPASIPPSGGVPPPRANAPSVTLEAPVDGNAGQSIEPPERAVEVAGRQVRIVETYEKLDLTMPTQGGIDVRFRLTLLPGLAGGFRANLKGLNCFVVPSGGTASPAMVIDGEGSAELISTKNERLGVVGWSFGTLRQAARVFAVASGELVVPFPHGLSALVLELGPERELIVICRRV